jgi:hypothetical protein
VRDDIVKTKRRITYLANERKAFGPVHKHRRCPLRSYCHVPQDPPTGALALILVR